jgi:hypothetical protein
VAEYTLNYLRCLTRSESGTVILSAFAVDA